MSGNEPSWLDRTTGFTLIELIIVVVLLGILSAVAIPKVGDIIRESKIDTTKRELQLIKRAIMGDPEVTIGGQLADKGYYGDMGDLPEALDSLVIQGSQSDFNRVSQSGWNGPYMVGDPDGEWKEDAWGNEYMYDKANGKIRSKGPDGEDDSGGDDDIVIILLD